ncbi:MAG TPA: ABC transporter permease [Gemmatimonadales bacterium]|nr:ABC transporter permease [Gemmatimonadales bacterium]
MTSRAERAATSPVSESAVAAVRGPHARHVHIAPSRGWLRLNLAELWAYRGLLFFLVWRDVKVRYAQTVLGATWAVLQPVFSMVVLTVIFGRFIRVPSEGVPYPVFSLSGLVAWSYFSSALGGASNSLVQNAGLITKVYFPRLVIPGAATLAALVDFAIALVVLLIVMLGFGLLPNPLAILILPFMVLLMMMTALGTGCWLSALNIQYRDFRHVTGFLVQMWMYASPIVYPLSVVPHAYRPLYTINPMASAISGFRAALLGTPGPSAAELAIAFGSATVLLLSGLFYFQRTERGFADVA